MGRLKASVAHVEDKAGDDNGPPENGGPDPNRASEEPCNDDGEKEACIGPKQEGGLAEESEHGAMLELKFVCPASAPRA
jgi:hypothetical protein